MTCSVEGCDRKIYARNVCKMHYARWLRHGDPTFTKIAPHGEPLRFLHEDVLPYKGDECLFWPYARKDTGYGHTTINRKVQDVHLVVCEMVHGPKPSPYHVASHTCGKGHLACCNPRHLKWQTRIEDQADRVTHGTSQRGAQNHNSVLTKESVLEILSLKGKISQTEIAKQFGVSTMCVSDIMTRKNWGWLK